MATRKGPGKQRDSKLGILGYGGYESKGMQFDDETECYSPSGIGFGTQYEDNQMEWGKRNINSGLDMFGLEREEEQDSSDADNRLESERK